MKKIIKYIKYPSSIIVYLMNKGYFKWLNDKTYLKIKYRIIMNTKLNLENPQTFNEKLQWLKLNDRNPEYTKMVDKYEAKKYVSDIVGEEYIIPTLGVWEKFEDIDFEKLPNQFVLKPTHTSGNVFICKDKNNIDYKKLKREVNKWMKRRYYYIHREWPYKNVKPRIIAEKYMQNKNDEDLKDYKFYCFNGIPRFLYVSEGLKNHKTAKIEFFDMNFKPAKFGRTDYKKFDIKPNKPIAFKEMKVLASILSKNIPFVRVDFYEINANIFFGELTFCPCAGYMPFKPEEWDRKLGDMLELPKEKSRTY